MNLSMWNWGKFLPEENVNISQELFDLCIRRDSLAVSNNKESIKESNKCKFDIKSTFIIFVQIISKKQCHIYNRITALLMKIDYQHIYGFNISRRISIFPEESQ